MLVEAIEKPMCYRWPDGEVQLVPGHPVDLPESRALRLLEKAHGKVRMVPQDKPDWLQAWREVATLTSGLTADDPRLPVVMAALNACDDAYLNGNWEAFCHAAPRVRSAMEGRNRRA